MALRDSTESTRAIIILAGSGAGLIFVTSMFGKEQPVVVALSVLSYLVVVAYVWGTFSRLQKYALVDALTGAANLRAWQEELKRAMSTGYRHSWPFCVAIIDVDKFKSVNDTYGHAGGDHVLKEVAKVFMGQLRDIDTFARCGGDEFMALLTNCDQKHAVEVIDRLRAKMPRGITFSAGVAEWDGYETAESLSAKADRGLYQAKAAGRNRVVAYT